MQSGAFAQLLLTFIAVASRIRMFCLELKEVHALHVACLRRVLEAVYVRIHRCCNSWTTDINIEFIDKRSSLFVTA